MTQDSSKDFFISYNKADREWAEWIAWQLEAEGYTTVLQAWDFLPGTNFVIEMSHASQQTSRTIALLSPDYLASQFTPSEWAAAFAQDPTSQQGKLLPIRVRACTLTGLLAQLVYLDLVDLDEKSAVAALRTGIARTRLRPSTAPRFPGNASLTFPQSPHFPGPSVLPHVWNVPFRRNPFFTGRGIILTELYTMLHTQHTAFVSQPVSISGLGGIGKTQTALEYAYRYGDEYQYVLWVRANTHETITTDFVNLAHLFQLPEQDAKDQTRPVEAVKQWLAQHAGWLLILDNADDLSLVDAFLPTRSSGHILFTTRTQVMGGRALRVDIGEMESEEGTHFLLRRAGILAPDAPLTSVPEAFRTVATAIVDALDGLPLALDQAGAYIEETSCGLSHYLDLYQTQRQALHARRSKQPSNHPEPVATTWSLSFQNVELANPAAAELLRCCAFLHPDAIPEELMTEGASYLSPILQTTLSNPMKFDEAISELLNYSLVRRLAETRSLSMHRLVQAVLKDEMDQSTQQRWVERIIQVVDHLFPLGEPTTWYLCQRYLPHAIQCADYIKQWNITSVEAGHLLTNTASYLYDRAQYQDAEPLCQQALAIRDQVLGPHHPDTAYTLNNLAMLDRAQGKYERAELLMQRSLAIREKILGPNHPDTAKSLNDLAWIYENQAKYEQAELLLQRALSISEQVLGSEHPNVASSLNNLGWLYRVQAKYKQAEFFLQRALAIREKVLGPTHPETAVILNNLARLYRTQHQYEKAETLYLRALAIREKEQGPDHPNTAISLNNLGELYHTQHQYDKAEPLYKRACAIIEQALGPEHPHIAMSLNNQARLYHTQGQYKKAEPLMQRALAIREKMLGLEHPETAICLYNLARLYSAQGLYEKAEPLMQRALAIREKKLGLEHPYTANTLESYASILQKMKRPGEAATLRERAKAIRTSLSSSI